MNIPFVSFILPVFNVEHSLVRKCVKSIVDLDLKQDEREIIVIDDGSELPVESCLKDFKSQIRILRQENQGLSVARNVGMQMAKGEYLQFIDPDDHLFPSIYDECLKLLKEHRPDVLKFHYTHDENTQYTPFKYCVFDSGREYMTKNNMQAGACAYIINRNVLNGLTFKPRILHEDEDFTPMLFLKAGKFILAETTPYFYFQRQNSIVESFSIEAVTKRLSDFYNIILEQNRLLLNLSQLVVEKSRESADKNAHLLVSDIRLKGLEISQLSVDALQRRVDQAAMDYLINVIRLNKRLNDRPKHAPKCFFVWKRLSTAIKQMKSDSLFPLSNKNYTKNYHRFSRLANYPILRPILLLIK